MRFAIFGREISEETIIIQCKIINWLKEYEASKKVGIFKMPQKMTQVDELISKTQKDDFRFSSCKERDFDLVCELLKRIFHDSRKPLFDDITEYIKYLEDENLERSERNSKFKKMIKTDLFDEKYRSLGLLLAFLYDIYSNNSINQTSTEHLALLFSINLTRLDLKKTGLVKGSNLAIKNYLDLSEKSKLLMKYFIKNFQDLFNVKEVKAQLQEYSHLTTIKEDLTPKSKSPRELRNSPRTKTMFANRHSSVDTPLDSPILEEDSIKNQNFNFNQNSSKYLSIWKRDFFIIKLKNDEFKQFLSDIIDFMISRGIVKLKMGKLSSFVICEGIDAIELWNSKQNSFPKMNSEEILLNLQCLVDIGVIEHNSIPDRNISDNKEIFKFTSQNFEDSNEEFTTEMTKKFVIFKKVHASVNDAIFVKKFYDTAFGKHSENYVTIKNRIHKFRILKDVFAGNEVIDWILKNYSDLNLDRYGATVLGESIRQLKAFDSVNCDQPFRDQQLFYTLREEVEFLPKEKLIEKSNELRFESKVKLSPKEQKVSNLFDKLIKEEIEQGKKEFYYPSEINFFERKPKIEQSSIFKLLKKFPKGSILHSHFLAMPNVDNLVNNLTNQKECFMNISNPHFVKNQIKYFPIDKKPEGFESLQELRNKSSNVENFNKDLINNWTLTKEDCIGDPNSRWIKFQNTFFMTDDLKWYKPVFKEVFNEVMNSLVEDNVQYLETNVPLGNLYDLEKKYSKEEHVGEFFKLNQEFVEKNKSNFLGMKLIDEHYRVFDTNNVKKHMNQSIDLQKKFKDFIVGFDLVGQEDHKNAFDTKHYIKDALKIRRKAKKEGIDFKFRFHGGESVWPVENLFDLVLLDGSIRIGHGYNLFRYPVLYDLIKKKNICLEICPISNSTLGYIHDLRNHPAIGYLSNSIPIVLSPDDPASFGYSGVTHDFYAALIYWNLNFKSMKKLAMNSIEYSGLNEKEKDDLFTMWNEKYNLFIDEISENINKF
eukprot:gene3505-6153_t